MIKTLNEENSRTQNHLTSKEAKTLNWLSNQTKLQHKHQIPKLLQTLLATSGFLVCSAFAWMPDSKINQTTQGLPPSSLTIKTKLPLSPADITKLSIETDSSFATQTKTNAIDSTSTTTATERVAIVHKGDTLTKIFDHHAVPSNWIAYLKDDALFSKYFTQIYAGQKFTFYYKNGELTRFSYNKDEEGEVIARIATDMESIIIEPPKLRSDEQTASGSSLRYGKAKITSNLYAAMKNTSIPVSLVTEFTDLFAWDVDFSQDLRAGDEFEILWEEAPKAKHGKKIVLARFSNQDKKYSAVRYIGDKGNMSYFDEKGNNLKKSFLRSPVDFARISSHFNLRRKHPVLHTIRAHKGVDYAASVGTPVKATGNGKVAFVGFKGGYGRVVVIQHGDQYTTLYAHLSKFAPGLKQGKIIEQGQTIGNVGRSGLATGPHLHYEFQARGVHQNPLTAKAVISSPLSSSASRNEFINYLALLNNKIKRFQSSDIALNR